MTTNSLSEVAMLNLLVVGSRSVNSFRFVSKCIRNSIYDLRYMDKIPPDEPPQHYIRIISGEARGVDRMAKWYAKRFGFEYQGFPAEWKRYGPGAGYRRNKVMMQHADACIAIWDGESKGTQHSIKLAEQKGIPLFLIRHD
jgi:hypothetical protein